MCGEHHLGQRRDRLVQGSSPHVRGALEAAVSAMTSLGIIPACAGSTQARPIPSPASRDHPRMCGEHGSHDRSVLVGDGIIPACAGSTSRRSARTARRWDHPRMCGEHTPFLYVDSASEGSSPHVRGALGFEDFHDFNVGIIPACAGST